MKAELRGLAKVAPLAVGGAGADAGLAEQIGARLLDGDPVTADEAVAAAT